jgi:tetratricopeptide (TPR) repeat protein
MEAYDRALVIKPDYYAALNNKGIALKALGKHDEAIETYDKALEIKPDAYEAWNNKGNALAALGKHDEAMEAYNNALNICEYKLGKDHQNTKPIRANIKIRYEIKKNVSVNITKMRKKNGLNKEDFISFVLFVILVAISWPSSKESAANVLGLRLAEAIGAAFVPILVGMVISFKIFNRKAEKSKKILWGFVTSIIIALFVKVYPLIVM